MDRLIVKVYKECDKSFHSDFPFYIQRVNPVPLVKVSLTEHMSNQGYTVAIESSHGNLAYRQFFNAKENAKEKAIKLFSEVIQQEKINHSWVSERMGPVNV